MFYCDIRLGAHFGKGVLHDKWKLLTVYELAYALFVDQEWIFLSKKKKKTTPDCYHEVTGKSLHSNCTAWEIFCAESLEKMAVYQDSLFNFNNKLAKYINQVDILPLSTLTLYETYEITLRNVILTSNVICLKGHVLYHALDVQCKIQKVLLLKINIFYTETNRVRMFNHGSGR